MLLLLVIAQQAYNSRDQLLVWQAQRQIAIASLNGLEHSLVQKRLGLKCGILSTDWL